MAAKGGELVTYDNDFILIGQSKQCARMREPRGVLKIKRYAQRLTHWVCMGDGGSSSFAPEWVKFNSGDELNVYNVSSASDSSSTSSST